MAFHILYVDAPDRCVLIGRKYSHRGCFVTNLEKIVEPHCCVNQKYTKHRHLIVFDEMLFSTFYRVTIRVCFLCVLLVNRSELVNACRGSAFLLGGGTLMGIKCGWTRWIRGIIYSRMPIYRGSLCGGKIGFQPGLFRNSSLIFKKYNEIKQNINKLIKITKFNKRYIKIKKLK